uniref:NADH-ubiquinone oxidoreductase chain 3 n=2 Tax=Anadara TaxID=6554 RepID=A0A088BHN0_9BIVA|nr:NADH dehydrogenase subunit 3 [Anadara sativa]AHB14363.1 NADH dehydrogenase subunit 3 [Anadara sativa]BAN00310.1 NADH dehydrogenase subunit 3 [Anadara broughtonii]
MSMTFCWEWMGVGMVACLLYFLSMVLGYQGGTQFREKSSPYECGFEPIGSARSSFSLRFFLMAMVFMIFDVEIVLLLPLLGGMMASVVGVEVYVEVLFFLSFLLFGLWFEWSEGCLEWL